MSELGAHNSRVSMHTGDSAPDGTNAALRSSAASNLLVPLVDVNGALSKVELGILLNHYVRSNCKNKDLNLVMDSLQLQQRSVLVLVTMASLESSEDSLDVESTGTLRSCATSWGAFCSGFLCLSHLFVFVDAVRN